MNQEELALAQLLNEKRQEAGLNPFILDDRLAHSGALKNQEIKAKGFPENAVKGSGFIGLIRQCAGGDYHRFGELISLGFTADKILNNFLKCSGQTQYIFDPNYTHLGVSILNHYPKIKVATAHFAGKK